MDQVGRQIVGGAVQAGGEFSQHAPEIQGHMAFALLAELMDPPGDALHVRKGRHPDHSHSASPGETSRKGVRVERMPSLKENRGLGPQGPRR